jgi:hypothetical protein
MRLPALWMREAPAPGPPTAAFLSDYTFAYRLGMAAVDVLLFVLLLRLVPQLFPHETSREQTLRLLIYLAATGVLFPLLYDRLDLLLALLVMLAFVLLLTRWHYAWSFALLAFAINFKLTPLILAPVWVIGSLRADRARGLLAPPGLLALGARGGLLAGMVLGIFLPFYLRDGHRCLSFLSYHGARGLEIGSVWATLLLGLQALGQPVTVELSYTSINVASALSPGLAALTPWLTGVVLLGATALLLTHAQSLLTRKDGPAPARATLAQLHPLSFVCYTLLFLMLFIAAGKVFSPQYLLWLAPLVCLLPLEGRSRRLFVWGFLLVCLLTTLLFPFLLLLDLFEPGIPDIIPPTIKAPTARLIAVLVLRNVLFLGLTAALFVTLLRGRQKEWKAVAPGVAPGQSARPAV